MLTVEEALDMLSKGQTVETSHAGLASALQDKLYWQTLPRAITGQRDSTLAVQIRWRTDGYRDIQDGKEKRSISYGAYVFTPLTIEEKEPGVY